MSKKKSEFASGQLVSEEINGVLIISLNRPEKLNSLNFEMIEGLISKLTWAEKHSSLRAVVIRGSGGVFTAGDDLKDMGTALVPVPDNKFDEYSEGYPQLCKTIAKLQKPVITQVEKYALGAGLEIALASDFIVAEREAKIGLPFVLRGFAAGTTLLPRLTNRQFASRLLFAGEVVAVTELEKFGLVHTITDAESVADAALDLAFKLADLPTKTIGLMKSSLYAAEGESFDTAWLVQSHATVSSSLTRDHFEGRQAFNEKRKAVFTGQ